MTTPQAGIFATDTSHQHHLELVVKAGNTAHDVAAAVARDADELDDGVQPGSGRLV